MIIHTTQKRGAWGGFASFARRLKHRSLAPIITPEQLHTELIRATVMAMIKIGIPFQFLVALSVARAVWITYEYHPSVFVTHMLSMLVIYATGIIFLLRNKPVHALMGIIITSMLELYIQMITTQSPALFSVIVPVLALPAIVLPRRRMFQIIIPYTLGFFVWIILFPFLQTKDWPSSIIITWSILIAFMTLGTALQGVLREYALTKDTHEEEAIERTRIETQNGILIEHNNRLLFAQHDLRGPCNTVLGTIEVLQMTDVDETMRRSLLSQLEPITLQLRSRIDSLFDQAKTTLLGSHAELPLINMTQTIQAHLPELRRMTFLVARAEIHLNFICSADKDIYICGRVGEIQRIMENLVLNATNMAATIIDISIQQTSCGETEICINDNGPGFPDWMLTQSLRLMASDREQGTGLGLAGVLANVHAFGGRVRFSNTSRGACVTINFPPQEVTLIT